MGQTEYTAAVLADSPVAFYKLDEASGLPQDSSGNGRHMTTTTGSPQYQQTGPFSGSSAIYFNAAGALENFSTGTPVSTATSNVSAECWGKGLQHASGAQRFMNNGDGITTGWRLYKDSGAGKTVSLTVGSSGNIALVPKSCSDDQWYHYVIVLNGTTDWDLHVNGDLFLADIFEGVSGVFVTPATETRIGPATNSANIWVSNVSFYDSILSPTRIRAHYEAALDYVARPFQIAMGGRGLA